MSRRAAFEVVDAFEEALCEFTGAPYAVAVDSCTNALFLALKWAYRGVEGEFRNVELPARTYVGVAQAARNAGLEVFWRDEEWVGWYRLNPTGVIDAAKQFYRGMYGMYGMDGAGTFTCVSFQAGKLLPIGRGGAILHDNPEADEWFRRARLDGRTEGASYDDPTFQREGWHMYLDPPSAARGLWLLTYLEDDDQADWTEYPDLSVASWT